MLVLTALSLILILTGSGVGLWLLRAFRLDGSAEPADRFFIAAWIGLLFMGGVMMLVAQVAPLNKFVFSVAIVAGLIAAFSHREELIGCLHALSSGRAIWIGLVIFVAVTFGISIYSSRDIAHFDTAFYMLPQMIWLEDHGLVTGIGLLHHRFGYNSSWLALVAPAIDFSHAGSLVALGSTVACALLVFQLIQSASRIISGTARPADWFLCAAPLPGLASPWLLSAMVSSSPDIPVWILTFLFGWVLLSDRERNLAPHAAMLAGGAMAIKISAAPLLAASAVYMLWSRQLTMRNLIACTIFWMLTLGAVMSANFVTSGCLLFPAAFTCLPVDWAIPAATGNAISRFISQWPFFGNINPFNGLDIAAYQKGELPVLSMQERAAHIAANLGWVSAVLGFLIAAALLALLSLRSKASGSVFIAAALGLAYCASVPAYRFAAGYLGILLGLVVAAASIEARKRIRAEGWRRYLPSPVLSSLVLAAGFAAFMAGLSSIDRVSDRDLRESRYNGKPTRFADRLLLPPEIVARQPNPEKGLISGTDLPRSEPARWVNAALNDVRFSRPATGEQCWGLRQPCTPPGEPLNGMRLRKPASGISGGLTLAR